jgi:hypothetical protein
MWLLRRTNEKKLILVKKQPMNTINQFIEQNTETIESYEYMDDPEKAQLESKFQAFARANKGDLAAFILEAEAYNYLLEVVYNSLYKDQEWESFFLTAMENMIRVFIKNPEEDESGADNFSKLESMGLSKLTDGPFGKKLLGLLVKQIDHSDPYISHKFLALVVNYWIFSVHDNNAVDKLKSKLNDSNWQIRWLAHEGLSYAPLAQNSEEIRIPFSDKVKYFLKNYFGNPYKPER